jgi:hypothetical protein
VTLSKKEIGAMVLGVALSVWAFGSSVAALGSNFEWAEIIPAPDNPILRMGMAFAGSALFFHAALLTKLLEDEVWLKVVDYFWYGGAIVSIAAGLWRLDVDMTSQRELDRWRASAIASIAATVYRLDEAEGKLNIIDAHQRLNDLCKRSGSMKVGSAGYEYCTAVSKGDIETVCKLPPLPNYAFGSEPAPEPQTLIGKALKFYNRLLGLPQGVREREFELARRVVCPISQTSTAASGGEWSTEELLSAIDMEKEVIGVGPTVQLIALILAAVAGLRITKTTAEFKKARCRRKTNPKKNGKLPRPT